MLKNYYCTCAWLLMLVLHNMPVFSQTKVIPYQQLINYNGNATGSGIFFGASMSTNTITVTFEGPADRWFAFGLGTSMSPTDVFMYSNGTFSAIHPVGWYDYYNSNSSNTTKDLQQDWTVISTGTVVPGQRTVTAWRALNTGDASDAVINYNASSLSLVWAHGASADYTIASHGPTNRAYGISLAWISPPTASFSNVSTTVCAGASVSYSNTSTGAQASYTWALQGASPAVSTLTNPSVVYASPGNYSVALTASNVAGTSTFTQVNYITVLPVNAPSVSINLSAGANPMCAGALATYTATGSNGGASPTFQWQVNGLNAGTGATYSSSTLNNSDIVSCILSSNMACASPQTATSAAITMTVNSTAPASASVILAAGSNPLCTGAPVTFTAATGNGGSSPAYQWQINNAGAGINSSIFTSSSLSNGDVVNCIVSSNAACASATLAVSAGITMSVSSMLVPSVSIALAQGSNTVCAGSTVTVMATPGNGGTTPGYQWQVNGNNVGTGSATFTTANVSSGTSVNCIMSSALNCSSPNTATSNVITLSVSPLPPAPAIVSSGQPTFCAGASVTLSSTFASGNLWSTGAVTQSILVTAAGSYTVVTIANGCSSLPSPVFTAIVNPLPAVSLGSIAALCASSGDMPLTGGSPAGGTYSGTAVTGTVFSPAQSGIGTFMITYAYYDANACLNTASISLVVDACLGIGEKNTGSDAVIVFPNPAQGLVTICSAKEKIKFIRVTNMSGKVILEKKFTGSNTVFIDLQGEAPGIYMADIMLENKTVHTRISKDD